MFVSHTFSNNVEQMYHLLSIYSFSNVDTLLFARKAPKVINQFFSKEPM